MSRAAPWLPHHSDSRAVLALAAGTLKDANSTEGVASLLARHGLLGMAVQTGQPSSAVLAGYARLAARQSVMTSHLTRLLETFAEESLRVAVLKGPTIAGRYEFPSTRTFTDLDLLVPRSERDRMIELLDRYPASEAIPDKRPQADKREVPINDSLTGVRFSIDLHWDAFSYRQLLGSARDATEHAWERATFVTDELGPRWELPADAEIAFLCAHAVLDHRFRLILFRDLVEIAKGGPNWDEMIEYSGRHGLRSTTYLAWLIAGNALEAEVPHGVLQAIRPSGLALRAAEWLLPRTDLVTFDGHRPHALNLAMVLAHDDQDGRARLAVRAPAAIVDWRRRVRHTPNHENRSLGILVASTQRRGAEVFCELLAASMRERGWDVDLLALSGTDGPAISARPLSRSLGSRKVSPNLVWRLRRHLRGQRYDVILAFGSSTLKYAVAANILLPRRPAVAYASIGEPLYWARSRRQRGIYRNLLRRVDLVLSVSERTSKQLLEHLAVPADKLRVTPIGVETHFLDISPRLVSDDFRVLWVGSLSPEKDPVAAIQAFSRIKNRHQAHLRLVGTGNLREQIEALVRRLGIDGLVEVVGAVDDIEPHLAWADVLILTSRTEGLPAVVLEAAAATLAVVAYDVGGVSEAVVDNETGRLVPAGDLEGLVTALDFYAGNRQAARQAGEAGRKRVAANFTIEASAARFDEVLSTIAEQR